MKKTNAGATKPGASKPGGNVRNPRAMTGSERYKSEDDIVATLDRIARDDIGTFAHPKSSPDLRAGNTERRKKSDVSRDTARGRNWPGRNRMDPR